MVKDGVRFKNAEKKYNMKRVSQMKVLFVLLCLVFASYYGILMYSNINNTQSPKEQQNSKKENYIYNKEDNKDIKLVLEKQNEKSSNISNLKKERDIVKRVFKKQNIENSDASLTKDKNIHKISSRKQKDKKYIELLYLSPNKDAAKINEEYNSNNIISLKLDKSFLSINTKKREYSVDVNKEGNNKKNSKYSDRRDVFFKESKRTYKESIDKKRSLLNMIDSYGEEKVYYKAIFIAKTYYELGNYKKAMSWALEANKINNEDESSWIIFAKANLKLGNKDLALKALKAFLNNNSSKKIEKLYDSILNKKE